MPDDANAAPAIDQAPPDVAPPDPNEARFANLEQRIAESTDAIRQAVAPKAPVVVDELEKLFDEPTKKWVSSVIQKQATEIAQREVANTVAKIIQQNTVNANPELKAEATKAYAELRSNPAWVNANEIQLNDMAIAQARANLAERKATQTTQQTNQQAAATSARAQAAGATLPSTSGGNGPPAAGDKEAFIKGFIANDENRRMVRVGDKVDPDSPRGQELLREFAESNFKNPVRFGGATATAMTNLSNQVEVVNR